MLTIGGMTGVEAQRHAAAGPTDPADRGTLALARKHRAGIVALLVAFVVIGAVLAAGRSGTQATQPEARATDAALVIAAALGDPEAQDELERRREVLLESGLRRSVEGLDVRGQPFGFPLRNGAPSAAAAISPRLRAIERMQDRASDTQFKKTPVDHALDGLALRKPPLHVLQWVLTDGSPRLDSRARRERFFRLSEGEQARRLIPNVEHTVYARVDEDQFYAMSERARAAAVNDFYRAAEKRFQQEGISDFVLVVTPYTPTTEHLPAFAIGSGGSASLTALGRTRPDPSGV